MQTVTSKDGTTIAFDQVGKGHAVILIGGAVQHRAIDARTAQIADLLSPHFTVIHYDRRGRGDSTDTLPYAPERETEDVEALIDYVGGSAYLFGNSSGSAIAIEAAIRLGDKVGKIAIFEAPYNDDESAQQRWFNYTTQLNQALSSGRHGDAAALFLGVVGTPDEQIQGMRHAPVWGMFESIAPTLAYDAEILGEYSTVPVERASLVRVPALVINGDAGHPFMHDTAVALANAFPNAQHHVLEGQSHDVAPEAIAPVLIGFFSR